MILLLEMHAPNGSPRRPGFAGWECLNEQMWILRGSVRSRMQQLGKQKHLSLFGLGPFPALCLVQDPTVLVSVQCTDGTLLLTWICSSRLDHGAQIRLC